MAIWQAGDGVEIYYEVAGEGPPVLLLHGFGSDARTNWVRPGVVEALVRAGFEAVTYDARGHGRSGKPHDPASYSGGAMVEDGRGLIEHLGYEQLYGIGYSMGSQVLASLAAVDSRLGRLVLGGTGPRLLLAGSGSSDYPAEEPADEIAAVLEAAEPREGFSSTARAYRAFADATGADRLALAAVQRARKLTLPADLESISADVLVVTGEADTLAGDPHELLEVLPGAKVQIVPGDHLSAVTKPEFAEAVVRFLSEGL